MSKYHNRKVKRDGYTFDSQAEFYRYLQLKSMQQAGDISGLEPHPHYLLIEAFTDSDGVSHRKTEYIADFSYVQDGVQVVEDVKGVRTAVFNIKEKLFLRRYPELKLRIVEV